MIASDSGFLAPYLSSHLPWLYRESNLWTMVGLVAAFMFSARFVIQWFYSEKHKRIVIPVSFWYLSFWGSLLQLIYLLHVDKAPLILGYFFLPIVNLRSLILHLRHEKGDEPQKDNPS